jgi:hypothetical protein
MRFEFRVKPATYPPWPTAPSHATNVQAHFELTDIQSHGIGCVRDQTSTMIQVPDSPQRTYYGNSTRTLDTHHVVLTVSLRRPPRFQVPITDEYGYEQVFYDGKRKISFRQGTARDFVNGGGAAELHGGPAGVFAEQETLKVSFIPNPF